MRGSLLDIPQRHVGIECGGNGHVPERVGPDRLGDPSAAGYPADDPGGAVPVQPPAIRRDEDRALAPLAHSQIDHLGGARGQRDGDHLASLAVMTCVRYPRSVPRPSALLTLAHPERSIGRSKRRHTDSKIAASNGG